MPDGEQVFVVLVDVTVRGYIRVQATSAADAKHRASNGDGVPEAWRTADQPRATWELEDWHARDAWPEGKGPG